MYKRQGLRISDILSLRWKQILGTDEFTVIEKKTGKVRTIRLNPQLQLSLIHILGHWTRKERKTGTPNSSLA